MTAPSSAVPPQVEEHDAAALLLETAAGVAAAGALIGAVQALTKWVTVQWAALFGAVQGPQSGPVFDRFVDQVVERIGQLPAVESAPILEYARRARVLGVLQGFREAGIDIPDELMRGAERKTAADMIQAAAEKAPIEVAVAVREPVDRATEARVERAVSDANAKRDAAAKTARTLTQGSEADVHASVAQARQAATTVEATARTEAVTQLNDGIKTAADMLGMERVWIAERTACLHCLALSGRVVAVGREFPASASFGSKPLAWTPMGAGGLTGPPRHPNCRCRCSPWAGSAAGGVDFPEALRREAERSVLNGYALPSESVTARANAADRLLKLIGDTRNSRSPSGWQVPQSVKERARRALRKGTFTTKPVPRGQSK